MPFPRPDSWGAKTREHRNAFLRLNRLMDPVIELDGLEVRFGDRTILKKLSAKLTGRSIGLLGPNRTGKTTLISTLLGFHKPSSATARTIGQTIRTQPRTAR